MERFYPIGTPGQPWTQPEKDAWFATQKPQRSYRDEVLQKLERLPSQLELQKYGALSIDTERFPLFAAVSRRAGADAPWALVTGGVHGYETSGVQGALAFLLDASVSYLDRVNLVVAPCVSPWGYEAIHRWNPKAIDPNRSFVPNSPAEESGSLMAFVKGLSAQFILHIDLHETTDTDESEFRPALAARDGKENKPGLIPDGFYLVGDTEQPEMEFQEAIIRAVEPITHIAPPDEQGQIIGSDVKRHGIIEYPCRELGLCAGMTDARFKTTTEVYPDSSNATPEICNAAQVAAVSAALDHALSA